MAYEFSTMLWKPNQKPNTIFVIIYTKGKKDNKAAINPIERFSAIKKEEEVLIAPYMLFEIMRVEHDTKINFDYLKNFYI